MKNPRLYSSFLIAAAVAVLLLTAARADEAETATIKFSDPSKPGTLRVNVSNGDIHVRGGDTAEVTVQSDLKSETPPRRKDGLRVLTSSSTYSLTEHDNIVSLTYGTEGWGNSGGDFTFTVPRNTAVIINNSLGGDMAVADTTGNIEIKSLNGEIVLTDIAAAALVETMNGEIKATVRELVANQPLSFTSINGEVTLHLPAAAKANVRLRTQNGSILTDFDEKALVTRTESMRTSHYYNRAPRAPGQENGDADVPTTVREAVRVSMEVAQEATREAAVAVKQAAIAARDAQRHAHEARDEDDDEAPVAPVPPAAPLPPMTGGKIVTGTLNGGGPEIRITTMNGDVTLRKIDPQK